MPTLNWIGKEAVVNHDKEVPFRLLKKIKAHSVGDNSQNLIIHGDNLEALKALMPYYIGKIKCIYIDPPYNTGNENWVYNDKVNSPKIKKWLGKIVGSDAQDLCRHDKWLCMMYPRLKLLKELLSDDGVIFVSIDDHEVHNLRHLMDEIFGEDNFISQLIWKKGGGKNDSAFLSVITEYVLIYRKSNKLNAFLKNKSDINNYKYIDDNGNRYALTSFERQGINYSSKSDYPIITPDGNEIYPGGSKEEYELRKKGNYNKKDWCWTLSKEEYNLRKEKGLIEFKKIKGNYKVYYRSYFENKEHPYKNFIDEATNALGDRELKELFNGKKYFLYPKSTLLIKKLLSFISKNNDADIILDSFAGSGTTGHAVLNLNKEDGGNRKFILVELEDNIAKDITSKRIAKAIEKYDYKAGFEYCELDKPLFDENGKIDVDCSFEQLATYIYFIESNTNLNKKLINKNYIGNFNDIEYYLLYKEKGKNVLTKDFLKNITFSKNKKIVYADKCLIDEKNLLKYNIIFKQIPYEIKVF